MNSIGDLISNSQQFGFDWSRGDGFVSNSAVLPDERCHGVNGFI